MVDNGGAELVCVRKVKVEAAAISELFGAQRTLVEAAHGME